jgi:predicted nucleotidyltransferase
MAIQEEQLERAVALAKAYGARRLILFGSALTRPEQARDLDLVPLTPPTRFTRLIQRRGKVLL